MGNNRSVNNTEFLKSTNKKCNAHFIQLGATIIQLIVDYRPGNIAGCNRGSHGRRSVALGRRDFKVKL